MYGLITVIQLPTNRTTIPPEQIPTAQTNKNTARVQVLAGEALGASATIKTQTFENQLSATVYL